MIDHDKRDELMRAAEYGYKPHFDFGLTFSRTFTGFFGNIFPIALFTILSWLAISLVTWPTLTLADHLGLLSDDEYNAIDIFVIILIIGVMLLQMAILHAFCLIVAQGKITGQTYEFLRAARQSLKVMVPLTVIGIIFFLCYYVGLILLIVPGVIIYVGWSLVGPAYIFEDTGVSACFSRSWALTRGYKWWVWLILIVVDLLLTVMMFLVLLVIFPVLMTESASDGSASFGTMTVVITNVVTTVTSVIYLGLHATMRAAMYVHCRELNDGVVNWTPASQASAPTNNII